MAVYKCRSCGFTSTSGICGNCKDIATLMLVRVEDMKFEDVLVATYKWLLGKFGPRVSIKITSYHPDSVKIYVSQAGHVDGLAYLDKSMPDFLQWVETNVLEK